MSEQTVLSGHELLNAYRQLREQAAHMVDLARQEDWPALVGEQEDYLMAVTALADLDAHARLDERQHRSKAELLTVIREHDLEIRSRLLARRDELADLIATSRRERDLNRSYGGAVGGAVVDGRHRFEKEQS